MTAIADLIAGAIYGTLAANTTLANHVGGTADPRIYEGQAPGGATYPLVLFRWLGGGDTEQTRRRDVRVNYLVECLAKSAADARTGAGYIDGAIRNAKPTVAGWSVYRCQMRDLFYRVEDVEGEQVYRNGAVLDFAMDSTT